MADYSDYRKVFKILIKNCVSVRHDGYYGVINFSLFWCKKDSEVIPLVKN